MNRWFRMILSVLAGLVLLACGWLIPAHLRAVDSSVLREAGAGTPSLGDAASELLAEQKIGAAGLLISTPPADPGRTPYPELRLLIANSNFTNAILRAWGVPVPELRALLAMRGTDWTVSRRPAGSNTQAYLAPVTVVELIVRQENRRQVLEFLNQSTNAWTRDLLRTRSITNTVLLPDSPSSAGQVFDAAVTVAGLLIHGGYLTPEFHRELTLAAAEANRGTGSARFEAMLMNLLTLGQRCNWGQTVEFVSRVRTPETLHRLGETVRQQEEELPVLFAAVKLSGDPEAVARYLAKFSKNGVQDLRAALQYRRGGLQELLQRGERLSYRRPGQQLAERMRPSFLPKLAWQNPELALALKWLLYGLGGFFLAMAMHFLLGPASELERPLHVRGFHLARETLFALGFLLILLLVSEPFLSHESQKTELPFKLRLPTPTSAAVASINPVNKSIMNQLSLLTLLLFFVLQGLIYTACLVKLAEVRRQQVSSRIKLRLLDNEDHLFDAGLYLGFVGTIISLILVSIGIIKPSLMAAYSSTSFGIIFVSIFKIFHLRPTRRRMLLEAEAAAAGEFVARGNPEVRSATAS